MELSIKIKIKDKEIELTEKEARELKEFLDGVLGNSFQIIPIYPTIPISPLYQPRPVYDPFGPPVDITPTIIC